jgi:hypothetical protein
MVSNLCQMGATDMAFVVGLKVGCRRVDLGDENPE